MKSIKPNAFSFVLLVSLGLLILTAVAFRFVPGAYKPIAKPYSTLEEARRLEEEDRLMSQTGELAFPQPTSAIVTGGGVLDGLGPNWTFVSQQDQKMLSVSFVAGTAPERETIVRLTDNGDVGLGIQESNIVDRKMLDGALASNEATKTTVAGKTAYLVPMGGLEGGTALLLVGQTSVLILQDAESADWPSELNPEVEMYVRTVTVP
jgi:hypothetical protein